MEALLIKFGYLILFVGVAVEGEFVLLAAAYLAHRGYFNLTAVILIATLANWVASQIYYAIARNRGRRWLQERFGQHTRYQRAMDLIASYSTVILLLSRFAFGFRIIIPAACGAVAMPMFRFTLVNLVAGIIWAVPMALLGYYFGYGIQRYLEGAHQYEFWIVGVLVIAAASILLFRHFRHAEWIDDLSMPDLHLLVPYAIGAVGCINLAFAIWPRSTETISMLQGWFPLEVSQHSRPLMLFSGLILLQITQGLVRRSRTAWFVATISLALTFLVHITRALDLHNSLVAGILLAYLIYFRRRFSQTSEPAVTKQVFWILPILALAVFLYGYVGFRELEKQFSWDAGADPWRETINSGILIYEPRVHPNTKLAANYLASLQITGWVARIYLLLLLLPPAMR